MIDGRGNTQIVSIEKVMRGQKIRVSSPVPWHARSLVTHR